MFRSGTTLMARMLNAHSKIVMTSDPFKEFFKSFRNEVYFQNGINIANPQMPLKSNFKSIHKSVNKQIEENDFNLAVKFTNLSELTQRIKKFSYPFSPLFSHHLERISADNFKDILNVLINTIDKAYHKLDASIIGFKEVWTEQFVSTFLHQFPQKGKAIFIVRDPRAVIASDYATQDHRYPLEFLVRQWRKSVCYALLYSKILNQDDDVKCLLIKYENLVIAPKLEIKRIMTFLGLDFESDLLDHTKYRDGNNQPWKQNTSYDYPESQFNIKSIDKWREVLTRETQLFIEYACFPEMKKLDYETTLIDEDALLNHVPYPLDDNNALATWIKEFYPPQKIKDQKWIQQVQNEERERNIIYTNGLKNHFDKLISSEIEDYFIDNRYFKYLIKK